MVLAASINYVQHAFDSNLQYSLRHAIEVFRTVDKRQVMNRFHALDGPFHRIRVAHIADNQIEITADIRQAVLCSARIIVQYTNLMPLANQAARDSRTDKPC